MDSQLTESRLNIEIISLLQFLTTELTGLSVAPRPFVTWNDPDKKKLMTRFHVVSSLYSPGEETVCFIRHQKFKSNEKRVKNAIQKWAY